MRYLVHRGTGTIIDPSDDVVIVDVDDDNIDESDILELAHSMPFFNRAVFMRVNEVVASVSDEDIVDMLGYNLDNEHYAYCEANPDTWPLIRERIMNTDSVFIEFNDTFDDAVYQVSSRLNEVARLEEVANGNIIVPIIGDPNYAPLSVQHSRLNGVAE
jgi:hypothetical protein